MAHTATEAVQEPAGRKSKRSGHGGQQRAGAPDNRCEIPLDLLPLLAPHRKRGRLSVRVEQMPPLARLSAGRNNGDNSWSLASDELEDLTFQPPANFDAPHTLAIRIIVYAGAEASTAALIDFEVSPDGSGGAALPAGALRDENVADDGAREQLQRLRDELAQKTSLLAEREAALTAAREDSEAARADLVLARDAWQKDLDVRVAELEKDAARLATQASAQAARWTEAAIAKAEEKWKADQATRLAAAQAQWRKDADTALGAARAKADQVRAAGETETRALKDELASVRKALSARDGELSQMRTAMAKAEADAAQAQRAAIFKAEETWKASEAATLRKRLAEREAAVTRLEASGAEADAQREQEQRDALAAAEERGKEQSARTVADLAARCARLEAELRAGTERSSAGKAELGRLREECSALRDTLAAREAELEQSRAMAADTASIPQAASASDRIEAALADATERYEAAEAALTDLRKRGNPHGMAETERLRDEVATLQAIQDQRDAELARAKIAAEKWYEYQDSGDAETGRGAKRDTRRANNDNDANAPRERGLFRDVVVVIVVVVAAVLFYPRIVASLPYKWQAMLPAFMSDDGAATYDAPLAGPPPSAAASPAAAPASAEHTAVIARGVNLRSGPSTKTDAVTTLKAGTEVSRIEEHSGWVHVRVPVHDGEKEPRTGWVYNSYLKAANERAAQSRAPH